MLSKDRTWVEARIKRALVSQNMALIRDIKDKLVKEGRFTLSEFQAFRIQPKHIERCSVEELYWFAEALEENNPAHYELLKYFTENDKKLASVYIRETEEEPDPLVFTNAHMLANNQWSAIASVSQLALLKKSNLVRVDPSLQRQSSSKRVSQDVNDARKIYVNKNRVRDIAAKIKDDKFYFNTIRLNVMPTGEATPPVIDRDGCIRLPSNVDIVVPDGHHRLLAVEQAYFDNPEMKDIFDERFFQVVITYCNALEVRDIITQEWNTQPVPKSHRNSLQNNAANAVINMIKADPSAEDIYAKRIVSTQREIKAGLGFILHERFAEALTKYFRTENIKLRAKMSELSSWLVEYYNYVAELYYEVFENYKECEQKNWLPTSWGWYALTCFASTIYNDLDWRMLTKEALSEINWTDTSIISAKDKDTEINILKICKEVCCRSVERIKKS